jgi:hypothetical protein
MVDVSRLWTHRGKARDREHDGDHVPICVLHRHHRLPDTSNDLIQGRGCRCFVSAPTSKFVIMRQGSDGCAKVDTGFILVRAKLSLCTVARSLLDLHQELVARGYNMSRDGKLPKSLCLREGGVVRGVQLALWIG